MHVACYSMYGNALHTKGYDTEEIVLGNRQELERLTFQVYRNILPVFFDKYNLT